MVTIPSSFHAVLTAKQARWPEVLQTPGGDPVIQIARRLRALEDFLAWFAKASERDVEWLIGLSLATREKHGPEWWAKFGIAELDPKGDER